MKQVCQHGWEHCGVCHDMSGVLWPQTQVEEIKMSKDYLPDAKKHLYTSLIKSAIRIAGYFWLGLALSTNSMVIWAVIVLILSEFIGIYEELV